MPTPELKAPDIGATDKETVQNLYDAVLKYRKELQFLLTHLDDKNIQPGSISAQSIATDTLIVGQNIQMGAGATISWENVSGKPVDLIYEAALSNYITNGELSSALSSYLTTGHFNTLIGEDYIVTGKIAANQIASGEIIGISIKTNAADNNRIELAADGLKTYNAANQLNGVYIDVLGGTSAFRIFKANAHRFSIFYGQEEGDAVDKLRLTTNAGVPMKLVSGSDMSLKAAGTIYFDSYVQFSAGANVVAKFG